MTTAEPKFLVCCPHHTGAGGMDTHRYTFLHIPKSPNKGRIRMTFGIPLLTELKFASSAFAKMNSKPKADH